MHQDHVLLATLVLIAILLVAYCSCWRRGGHGHYKGYRRCPCGCPFGCACSPSCRCRTSGTCPP